MTVSELRRGYLYGLAAYVCWGFFPLYFKLLRPAGPLEILAHRVIWSAVFVALLLSGLRGWRRIAEMRRRPRTLAGVALAAALIAVNWGVYIYGVNSAHVVETSLGYFVTPLISVAFGLLLFGERLRGPQWVALGLGALAVVVLTVDYGRLPWIALTLAVSFASSGLIKTRLGYRRPTGCSSSRACWPCPGSATSLGSPWPGTARWATARRRIPCCSLPPA
jgi:chloramphenicol-sensitive protein RarD